MNLSAHFPKGLRQPIGRPELVGAQLGITQRETQRVITARPPSTPKGTFQFQASLCPGSDKLDLPVGMQRSDQLAE